MWADLRHSVAIPGSQRLSTSCTLARAPKTLQAERTKAENRPRTLIMETTGKSLAGSGRGMHAPRGSRGGTRAPRVVPRTPAAPYTSRIIKAGALLADTKTLLSHWDIAATVKANLARIRQENLFGKASRSRVEDILAIFRQRYLSQEEVAKALVIFVQNRLPAVSLDRILFFHSAQNDRLLHDAVTELLLPLNSRGATDVDVLEVQRTIAKWVAEGKATAKWGDATILRVTQGLLSALRDFGILQGAVNKRIAPVHLPIEAFAHIAFYLSRQQPSATKLMELPEWKLFFLPPAGVERFLIEAHQHNLLEYHAAGMVTRLVFPVNRLEEYANVVAQRPH